MKVKLSSFLREVSIKTTENNQYPVLTSSKSGLFLQSDYFNKQVASKDNTGYKIIRRDQFTYRAMSDTGEFFPNMLECADIGIVSPAYPVFEIIDTETVVPEYLKYFFRSDGFQHSIASFAQGSTRTSVKFDKLKTVSMELLLPFEQKKIVSILNEAAGLIALRQQQLDELDNLIKARFVEMFGDPKYNKDNLVKIGDIGTLTSGGTPSRTKPEYFEGDIRWYSAGELNSLYLPDSIEHISDAALRESSAKLFKKGTLMIGMYDTAAFKMGILTENSSSNQACANLNHNCEYNVVWLYYLFDIMKPVFLKERQGVRQKNLSLSKIKDFEVPNASIELQNQFAAFVEQTDKSKVVVQKALEEAQLLFDSLMQEYFG